MGIMDKHVLKFENMPFNKPKKAGRTFKKMSQQPLSQEIKAQRAHYAKSRGEHIKDIIITILVVSIVAFIGGMTFEKQQQATINDAIKTSQTAAAPTPAPTEVKK